MSVGARYNWPTAGVCAAFHPRIDFTPSLCPSSTPPLCNNNHQPTNQPYPTLSYPLPLASQRNFSLYPTCFSISLERTVARVHIRCSLTLAHTLRAHEAHERAGTKNERGTSERAGVGGEGGGTHKGRWLGSRVTHESHESARRGGGRRRGRREGRAAEMDRERMEGEEGGGKGTREASVLQLIFTPVWFIRARYRQPRFSCPRAPTMEESPANQSAYTVHPLHSSPPSSLLFSSLHLPPTSRSPRPKIYGLPRRFFLDRRDPFSGSRSAPASPRIPDHFRENDSVTRWIFSTSRVSLYLFISRVKNPP